MSQATTERIGRIVVGSDAERGREFGILEAHDVEPRVADFIFQHIFMGLYSETTPLAAGVLHASLREVRTEEGWSILARVAIRRSAAEGRAGLVLRGLIVPPWMLEKAGWSPFRLSMPQWKWVYEEKTSDWNSEASPWGWRALQGEIDAATEALSSARPQVLTLLPGSDPLTVLHAAYNTLNGTRQQTLLRIPGFCTCWPQDGRPPTSLYRVCFLAESPTHARLDRSVHVSRSSRVPMANGSKDSGGSNEATYNWAPSVVQVRACRSGAPALRGTTTSLREVELDRGFWSFRVRHLLEDMRDAIEAIGDGKDLAPAALATRVERLEEIRLSLGRGLEQLRDFNGSDSLAREGSEWLECYGQWLIARKRREPRRDGRWLRDVRRMVQESLPAWSVKTTVTVAVLALLLLTFLVYWVAWCLSPPSEPAHGPASVLKSSPKHATPFPPSPHAGSTESGGRVESVRPPSKHLKQAPLPPRGDAAGGQQALLAPPPRPRSGATVLPGRAFVGTPAPPAEAGAGPGHDERPLFSQVIPLSSSDTNR